MMPNKCIAVDIGGTRVKVAAVRDGMVLAFTMIPSHSEGKLADRLPDIEQAIITVAGSDFSDYAGLGLSLPCLVNPETRRATEIYGKFEDAPSLDLPAWCEERFGLPLIIEQDSKAALLGEVTYGCAKGERDALMLIMGTGVGTAVLSDGRMLDGPGHFAGSLGSHIVIDAFHGRACTCGGRGCLEAYTSGWALPGLIREHAGYADSALASAEPLGFYELGQALKRGDKVAADTLQKIVIALRAGIVSLIHAYNPQTVILSGGPVRLGDAFLTPLLDGIENEVWGSASKPRFRVAQNPEESVLLGLCARLLGKC